MPQDDVCHRECYNANCMFEGEMDGGACDAFCDANDECALINIGDGTCQEACFTEHCDFDSGDCNECSRDCPWLWVNDGQCDPLCYTQECGWDGPTSCRGNPVADCPVSDCIQAANCSAGCAPNMVGDGECQDECSNSECRFDGGDCFHFCDRAQNCPIGW